MAEELFKNMHLQLSAEDIRKIDEWKISRGMKSRTEAIRSMIRIVTSGNLDEDMSDIAKTILSESGAKFMRPEHSNREKQRRDTNESVEELIRKVVKEELEKMLDDN